MYVTVQKRNSTAIMDYRKVCLMRGDRSQATRDFSLASKPRAPAGFRRLDQLSDSGEGPSGRGTMNEARCPHNLRLCVERESGDNMIASQVEVLRKRRCRWFSSCAGS